MKGLANRLKDRRVVLLFSLALACVVLALILTRHDTPPAPVIVFRQPGEINMPKGSLFDRWIPKTRGWAWTWRLQETVFGRRRTVNLDSEIFGLADSSASTTSGLHLGKPSFSDTKGLQIWLLGQGELKALRERFKQISGVEFLSRPRITTAEDVHSSIFQGETILLNGSTNEVGLGATCFPRLRSDCMDLFAILTVSE